MRTLTLPNTLSETLALAINDARQLDRTLYHPHCRFWHGYNTDFRDRCVVCLAGSIISQSFKTDRNICTSPSDYPIEINRKLSAINLCRIGDFLSAFQTFYNRVPAQDEQWDRLNRLAVPRHYDFIGWEQFDAHLDSIESIIPLLREIENASL